MIDKPQITMQLLLVTLCPPGTYIQVLTLNVSEYDLKSRVSTDVIKSNEVILDEDSH